MLADYTIRSAQGHSVRGFKPSNPVLPTLGYGGHPIGARPKRKALTIYQGRQPFVLEVPMVLFRGGASIEPDREALENMATSEGELLTQAPPVVKITASYRLPIPPALGDENTARWWIEDLKWADEFRKPPHEGGFMTFKEVTVSLLEWSKEPIINGGFRMGNYRVKKPPDTMKSIAAHHSMTVEQLREANPKLRSDGSLKDGMTIKAMIVVPFTVVKEGDF